LSDSLCRASTGDGDVRRALYTDSDVSVQQFRRCPILNGVDLAIGQGDLAERVLPVDLKRPEKRRREDELAGSWHEARPYVFGGLLDLAAQVLDRLPAVKVDDMPRMADFAAVLAAVDEVLHTKGLARYRERSKRVAADTLDDPFIAALVEKQSTFSDKTSAEILGALTPDEKPRDWPKEWPQNARAVTGQLTRHGPALRSQGWVIDNDRGQNKASVLKWTIRPPEEGPETDPPNPPNPHAQVNNQKSGGSVEILFPADNPVNPPGGEPAGQAGNAEMADPPNKPTVTSDNGSAGQAGHEFGQSLDVSCRDCGRHLPEHMHSARARGICSRCTAIEAAKAALAGGAS
jgi:hypothetical protein